MKIGFDDLVMDEHEVELVLDQHGVTATEATVAAVLEHTSGWACGVRLAALSLEVWFVEAALCETDEQINRFLDRKIISKLPPVARDMIVATSVAEEVSADLAYSMAANSGALLLDSITGYDGFIDLRPDGSFRCHPLLRRAALARLSRRSPSAVQGAYRQAAHRAARAHVRSLAVPRMLAGAGSDIVQRVVESKEFAESEPLLLAAAALTHSWLDLAESALARATSELTQAPQPETTTPSVSPCWLRPCCGSAESHWTA